MSVNARIAIPEREIADFCRRHHIVSFSLFGSVLRDDFRPDSDVDVLVEFEPDHIPGLEFFGMPDELAELFGRKVDVVDVKSLRNPFRRHDILRTQQVVYAASRPGPGVPVGYSSTPLVSCNRSRAASLANGMRRSGRRPSGMLSSMTFRF